MMREGGLLLCSYGDGVGQGVGRRGGPGECFPAPRQQRNPRLRRPQVEKAEKREEAVAVAVVQLLPAGVAPSAAAAPPHRAASRFLLVQRPATGLLAGLWQFPLLPLGPEAEGSPRRQHQLMDAYLEAQLGVQLQQQGAASGQARGGGGGGAGARRRGTACSRRRRRGPAGWGARLPRRPTRLLSLAAGLPTAACLLPPCRRHAPAPPQAAACVWLGGTRWAKWCTSSRTYA